MRLSFCGSNQTSALAFCGAATRLDRLKRSSRLSFMLKIEWAMKIRLRWRWEEVRRGKRGGEIACALKAHASSHASPSLEIKCWRCYQHAPFQAEGVRGEEKGLPVVLLTISWRIVKSRSGAFVCCAWDQVWACESKRKERATRIGKARLTPWSAGVPTSRASAASGFEKSEVHVESLRERTHPVTCSAPNESAHGYLSKRDR